ncbi:hypothetical protein EJ110_NYTH38543 [Nymphaea thermarum]|nr:hypothetical protein EJ110_NYTH38543 [Nymphaea thermarum]
MQATSRPVVASVAAQQQLLVEFSSAVQRDWLSYMGKLRLAVGAEQGFLDSEAMTGCFEEAFAKILDAVRGRR